MESKLSNWVNQTYEATIFSVLQTNVFFLGRVQQPALLCLVRDAHLQKKKEKENWFVTQTCTNISADSHVSVT